jgi:quercetin dioxygenase-like cupin family protein
VSLLNSPFSAGNLTGTVYFFETSNDVLERHFHEVGLGHITIVSSGAVKIVGQEWEKVVNVGGVIDLPDGQWHEIYALKDNTKIVNINKGGLNV